MYEKEGKRNEEGGSGVIEGTVGRITDVKERKEKCIQKREGEWSE